MAKAADKARDVLDDREHALGLLRTMLLVRRFEERAEEQYTRARIGGYCHLAIGEEAANVNGQMFLSTGTSYALIAPPRPVSTIWKQGRWTVDELIETVPDTLMLGVANPAPPRAEGAEGAPAKAG